MRSESATVLGGITVDKWRTGHLSVLRYPDIAQVLYLRGLMEKLGRGSLLIQHECEANGLPAPKWEAETASGVRLTFFTPQVTTEVEKLLRLLAGEMRAQELRGQLGIVDREYLREAFLRPALDAGLIEMTDPDKPRSSKQRYRLTPLGNTVRAQHHR